MSPDISPERSGAYVLPWGRIGGVRPGIEAALKLASEGGTGVAAKFVEWCKEQTAPFLRERTISLSTLEVAAPSFILVIPETIRVNAIDLLCLNNTVKIFLFQGVKNHDSYSRDPISDQDPNRTNRFFLVFLYQGIVQDFLLKNSLKIFGTQSEDTQQILNGILNGLTELYWSLINATTKENILEMQLQSIHWPSSTQISIY